MGSTCSSSQSVNGETSNKNMGNRRSSHSSTEDKEKDKEREREHRSGSSNAQAKTPTPAQSDKPPTNPPLSPPKPAESPHRTPLPEVATPKAAGHGQMSPGAGKPAGKAGGRGGSSLPDLLGYSDDVRNMLLGKVALVKAKPQPKSVRIYISAASIDSDVERNALVERVYPKLRSHCANSGYEFHAVDLSAGLWDPKLNDHQFLDHCLQEIRYCQASSTGPNFMTFLNMKYNPCRTPIRVLASAFDRLLKKVGSEEERSLLTSHYKLDANAAPPIYLLQGCPSEEEAERVCEILRSSWGKEEKERYMASVSEMEIDEGVFSPTSISDAVIWLHRRFTRIDANDDTANIYLDLLPGNKETDTQSHEQLAQLCKRLVGKVNEGNFIKFDIPWSPKGLDPDGVSMHAKYLDDICSKTQQILTELIDRAVAERHEEEVMQKKTHRRLFQELQQHTCLCQRQAEGYQGQSDLLHSIQEYLEGDVQSPLVIHGAAGAGKTAAAAAAVRVCSQVLPHCACVVRFVGATPESSTPNQVLRSACEQIAYLYGEHISVAAKGANRLSKDLPTLLKRVTEHRPLVVVLDGIDQFSHADSPAAFNWIPDALPSNVKMILTMKDKDFDGFEHLKGILRDSASFVEIPPLNGSDANKMVDSLLKAHGRTLCDSQAKVLREAVGGCPNPLYIKMACHVACTWNSYDPSSATKLEREPCAQMNALLDRLEQRYGKTAVTNSLGYLCVARDGISDAEMDDLLSCDDAVLDELYASSRPAVRRAPGYLWVGICQELAPFLREAVIDERSLRTWAHVSLRELVAKRYVGSAQTRTQLHKNMLDYFKGRWAKSKKKPFVKEGGIEVLMDRYAIAQPAMYGSHPNHRRFSELVHHSLHSGEKKFADKYVWDTEWFRSKLEHSDVYRILEDVALALGKEPGNADLQLLTEFLQASAYALSTDGSQVFTQLRQRLSGGAVEKKGSSYPKMQQLFKQAAKPPLCNFFPSRDCLHKVDAKSPDNDDAAKPKAILTGLFRVPSNDAYMVSVASEEGEMKVWNITTQKCVRTLRNLNCPRDVRFIDEHRVVVLCHRELLIFNLDTGSFETKLKGIMNQKMPYYSMSDAEHVVALSRNRMYVNMINVNSGDVVSTFKVGEDRFLNSLLVSTNGHRCVCGDDTQKPSPLLVWDLSARKLIHDFRINQHEFVTRMAAISNDGHYVVSVIKELDDPTRNFIIVYDLQSGQQFKKWKPLSNTTCVAITSEGQCVVNGCEDCSLIVWDLASGSLKHTLQGHTHSVDSIYLSEDGKRCLSYDSTHMDRSLRMWDLQQGVGIATFTPDFPISCCQISASGDCAVIGQPGQASVITLWLRSKDLDTTREGKKAFGDASLAGNEFDMTNVA